MTVKELEIRAEQLKQDNKQLKNRCWALTNGLMCQFCSFEEDCVHSKPKNDEPKRKVRDIGMTELKKCPFCGGAAKIEKYTDGTYAVACSSMLNECEVQPTSSWHYNREKAIEAWNRRAE